MAFRIPTFAIVLIALAIAVGLSVAPRPPGTRPDRSIESSVEKLAQASPQPPAPSPSFEPAAESEARHLREFVPSVEILREEIVENPHRTPPSILSFSVQMAQRMSLARQTRRNAEGLMAELMDCTLSHGYPEQIRAICLRNSARLARFHPEAQELAHASEEIRSQAPPSILRLATQAAFQE